MNTFREKNKLNYSTRYQSNYTKIFFSHAVTTAREPGPPHCRGFTITLKANHTL